MQKPLLLQVKGLPVQVGAKRAARGCSLEEEGAGKKEQGGVKSLSLQVSSCNFYFGDEWSRTGAQGKVGVPARGQSAVAHGKQVPLERESHRRVV